MEKREIRRDRTIRYGTSTRREHLRIVHPTGDIDCVCEQSVWFFAKRKSLGCSCRRSPKGNPKLIRGLCHGMRGYHPCVRERIDGKRLCRDWKARLGGDLDDVELLEPLYWKTIQEPGCDSAIEPLGRLP